MSLDSEDAVVIRQVGAKTVFDFWLKRLQSTSEPTTPSLLSLPKRRSIPGEDHARSREVRINCPDATGLGVDVFRVLLDFGLRILHADVTTDGTWCLLVLVVSLSPGVPPRWQLLHARLKEVCPSDTDALRLLCPSTPKKRSLYALHVSGYDRQGMLHALTHALWEADTSTVKVHVTTAPSGEVRDTFWLYDNREELPQAHRVLEICDRVKGALGPDVVCVIEAAPSNPVVDNEIDPLTMAPPGFSPFKPTWGSAGPSLHRMSCKDTASSSNLRAIVGKRKENNGNGGGGGGGGAASSFGDALTTTSSPTSSPGGSIDGGSSDSGSEPKRTPHHHHHRNGGSKPRSSQQELIHSTAMSSGGGGGGGGGSSISNGVVISRLLPSDVAVEIDNGVSSSYTLITLRCKDRKGLLYDILLKLKEVALRVAFGRLDVDPSTGDCTADLYVQDSEYGRVEDAELVDELTQRLREAVALPVRIAVHDVMQGTATEITVAANVDVGGRGRPRVTYDVTQGLCAAGLGVACADVYVAESEPPSPSNPGSAEEIHRFLVHVPHGGGLESEKEKTALIEVVRSCLLGIRAPPGAAAISAAAAAVYSAGGAVGGEVRTLGGSMMPLASPPLVRTMSEHWRGP